MLPPGSEHPGLYRNGIIAARQPQETERGPAEVNEENW
jgi:hypothetical protein